MTETETMVRDGLRSLARESSAIAPPPLDEIVARAGACTRPPRAHRAPSRARRTAVFAIAGLVGTAGVAAANGVLPGPVERTLHEFHSWGFKTTGEAEQMATLRVGDDTVEIWRAPLKGGGECVYERRIAPDGEAPHGGSSACTPDSTDENALYPGAYPEQTGDGATAWGQLPLDGVAIVFDLGDGSTYRVGTQHDSYFLTGFAGVPDGTEILGEQVERADGTLYRP